MLGWLRRLRSDETGQDLVEYALLVALVSLAVTTILTALAGGIDAAYQAVIDALAAAIP